MSYIPQTHQNEYKMSNHRYKSNGLADEKFPQSQSRANQQQVNQVTCKSKNYPQTPPNNVEKVPNCTNPTVSSHKQPQRTSMESMVPQTQGKPFQNDATTKQSIHKNDNTKMESTSHIEEASHEEEALDRIERITKDIEKVYKETEEIIQFEQDSEYKKYEEFFLQKNIELDNVDPRNNELIREFRKAAVKYVQDCMYNLDQKQKTNTQKLL